ncbi:N-acetyl-gamma-glutamyl-phosphate reductase [Streptomyces sp. NBRC 110611]|nr:N-acetyl-gamma-glutamyl-phosphate reductase [Streptomyces sp. NBRC 110611]
MLHLGEMASGLGGEACCRRANPDVTAAMRGSEVRVVAGRSERGGSRQAQTGGDSRSPDLGGVRRSRPGLGQSLDQPVSRSPTPVGQRPKRVATVRRTHGNHDLIVEAATRGRNSGTGVCVRPWQRGELGLDGTSRRAVSAPDTAQDPSTTRPARGMFDIRSCYELGSSQPRRGPRDGTLTERDRYTM